MLAFNATTNLNNGDASNGGRKNFGFFASGSSILPRRKSFDGMNKKSSSKGGGRRQAIFSPPPSFSSSSSSSVLVFPEQEDEAYPYLSRRRRIAESEGGKFVRGNISSTLYEHELQLKDDGVVEYAVRRRIETTIETSGGGKDVLNTVYSRLQEGILGGSNTMDDSIRSREASAKEVREFLFGSDEALETRRRSKGPPLYQTLDNHRAKTFHVCETKSQSAFGKSIMKTFVSSDRSTGSIAFKMIEAKNSRVFEVYEGSNAIEIGSDGSIYIVARGKAKMKGLLKKFAHKQVANVLVSKMRANLERTRDAIDGGASNAKNNNNGDAALFA